MSNVTKYDDVIDSREVIKRIEDLEDELQAEIIGDDDKDELAALQELQKEAEGYSEDWLHGSTLVRDSYFQEYAQELAEDCGMIKSNATWPNNCIDWEEAARQLKQDYTEVDFDGVTYWVR